MGSPRNKFSVKVGILSQGGEGLTQSQIFQTKTTTIEKDDFVGILLQYGAGSPVPTKNSPKMNSKITKNHIKITYHRKKWLFHEKYS